MKKLPFHLRFIAICLSVASFLVEQSVRADTIAATSEEIGAALDSDAQWTLTCPSTYYAYARVESSISTFLKGGSHLLLTKGTSGPFYVERTVTGPGLAQVFIIPLGSGRTGLPPAYVPARAWMELVGGASAVVYGPAPDVFPPDFQRLQLAQLQVPAGTHQLRLRVPDDRENGALTNGAYFDDFSFTPGVTHISTQIAQAFNTSELSWFVKEGDSAELSASGSSVVWSKLPPPPHKVSDRMVIGFTSHLPLPRTLSLTFADTGNTTLRLVKTGSVTGGGTTHRLDAINGTSQTLTTTVPAGPAQTFITCEMVYEAGLGGGPFSGGEAITLSNFALTPINPISNTIPEETFFLSGNPEPLSLICSTSTDMSLTATGLPPGISFAQVDIRTWRITGTLTQVGDFPFSVQGTLDGVLFSRSGVIKVLDPNGPLANATEFSGFWTGSGVRTVSGDTDYLDVSSGLTTPASVSLRVTGPGVLRWRSTTVSGGFVVHPSFSVVATGSGVIGPVSIPVASGWAKSAFTLGEGAHTITWTVTPAVIGVHYGPGSILLDEVTYSPLVSYNEWAVAIPSAVRAADADADSDGTNNLAEFAFGTDPQNPASFFVPNLIQNNGAYTISIRPPLGHTGVTYSALYSQGLSAQSWTPLPNTGSPGAPDFVLPEGEKGFVKVIATQ